MPDHSKPNINAKQEIGVMETSPASDPVGHPGLRGVRAVPPETLLPDPARPPSPKPAMVMRHFPDAESAQLALEAAVRQGPIDRRSATLGFAEEQATLWIEVAPAEVARIDALLLRHGALDL